MSYIVDIDKSILIQKVSEQKSIATKILDSFTFAALYFAFTALIIHFISDLTTNTLEIKHFILLIISVVGLSYMTIGFSIMNKLQNFKITNREEEVVPKLVEKT